MSDVASYVAAWRVRWSRERAGRADRAARAREVGLSIARVLHAEYGVSRVVLFGSVARGECHSGSDLDLAVAGLAADTLFRAGARAESLAPGIDVDLVPLESVSPALLDDIRRDGVDLLPATPADPRGVA
jgi:predicted nucleotidyltransferase